MSKKSYITNKIYLFKAVLIIKFFLFATLVNHWDGHEY